MVDRKKLDKDITQAINWGAAEYDYVRKLREEIEQVEKDTSVEDKLKDIHKAAKILKYVSGTERRAYKFEERVKKDVYKLLEKYDVNTVKKSNSVVQTLRSALEQLDVEENTLITYFSRYKGLLAQELKKGEAQIQLLVDISAENPKEGEKFAPEVLRHIQKIHKMLEDAEKWVAALEATLAKIKDVCCCSMNRDVDLNSVIEELKKKGFNVSESDFEKVGEGVNEVFKVFSSKGDLIVNIGLFGDESVQKETRERVFYVGQFLEKDPKVPSSKMVCSGVDSKGNPFVVQELIHGTELAEIEDKLKYIKELAGILSYLHGIDAKDFGHFHNEKGVIKGKHQSWLDFLQKDLFKDLKLLEKHDVISEEKREQLNEKFVRFFGMYKKIFLGIKGKFLHGDIRFRNILVEKEKINALIDLEWSLSGDPAYEFTCVMDDQVDEQSLLSEYFKIMKKFDPEFNEANFRFRIRLYEPIKMIFIANTFKANAKRSKYFIKESEKKLDNLLG